MLLEVKFPHEPFNTITKDGTAGKKIQSILEATKPEATYFTNIDGHRTVIMIINLEDPSKVPSFAEPWFLQFNADCQFRIVMTPDVLAKAGLEDLGKKWA
jgi:hypothetical protein